MKYKSTIWQAGRESFEDHSLPIIKEGYTLHSIIPKSFDPLTSLDFIVIWQQAPKRNTAPRKTFIPPTLEEVRAYIEEKEYNIDAKTFFDHYADRGWCNAIGRPIRDWKQTMRENWVRGRNIAQPKEDYLKVKY